MLKHLFRANAGLRKQTCDLLLLVVCRCLVAVVAHGKARLYGGHAGQTSIDAGLVALCCQLHGSLHTAAVLVSDKVAQCSYPWLSPRTFSE